MRQKCKSRCYLGMLLDAAEIICGDGPNSGAVRHRWAPLETESVAFVCCPKPYKPCSLAERVPNCDDVVAPFLGVDPKSLTMASGFERLQQARGALARAGDAACASLAPEEPRAVCRPKESKEVSSFTRRELFCEMMLWQSEQLGDGDKREYEQVGCPWAGVTNKDTNE